MLTAYFVPGTLLSLGVYQRGKKKAKIPTLKNLAL